MMTYKKNGDKIGCYRHVMLIYHRSSVSQCLCAFLCSPFTEVYFAALATAFSTYCIYIYVPYFYNFNLTLFYIPTIKSCIY